MDMPINKITSESLIPIENHFRVSAGPGAGKTHWLTMHIQNVLQNSLRLGRIKKIACITYTNIAVETILKRLTFVADRVEISTIHSFLYKNIIVPYISFIAPEYEFDPTKMDGHVDHFVSRKRITEWIKSHPNRGSFSHPYSENQLTRIDNNLEALGNWLNSIKYSFNGDKLEIKVDNSKAFYFDGASRRNLGAATCLDKLSPGLIDYKKIFWRKGILHHDDVLFFAYNILKKYPFILTVLRGKFPYFFIDEFQDTNPIQAEIVSMIGQNETVVGIIGDKAQSIYSFQGASPKHFEEFTLSDLQDYVIEDNRRSTNAIIDILNHIRKDITQKPLRKVAGAQPVLLVGLNSAALAEVAKITGSQNVTTLSRDNITSNAMKRHFDSTIPSINLISALSSTDSNSDRRRVIVSCINAVELAKQKRFKDAIKEMQKNFRHLKPRSVIKKSAFGKLALLLANYDSYKSSNLIDFFNLVRNNLRGDIAMLTRGAAFDFYNKYTFEQLAVSVNISEDNSPSRTIHKSKGDEFENVLVILKSQPDLQFLLSPNLLSEEQRVLYVAVSRSREMLFLNVPELDFVNEGKLNSIINIIRL